MSRPARTAISLRVIVLGIVGLVMSMIDLIDNGTGSIWLGVVIAAVALAASFFLGGATWVMVAASICAIALFSALYMEHQMTEKRTEIGQMLSSSYRS
jgi:membrane protein implicated in regulation of membrane protease activity